MSEEQIKETLQRLGYYAVRNEIVCEYFLTQELPTRVCDIGAKVREQLGEETNWQRRFAGLFPDE